MVSKKSSTSTWTISWFHSGISRLSEETKKGYEYRLDERPRYFQPDGANVRCHRIG
jgi:hypothetical protein